MIRFKQHLHSCQHRKNYCKVYPNVFYKRNRKSYTPWIFFKDITYKFLAPQRILGLSQMTLCFSSESKNGFYLCHVCEEMFHVSGAVKHIVCVNHHSNYFANTDPNALSFSFEPSGNDIPVSLMDNIKKEQGEKGIGKLWVLHMPDGLFQECTSSKYHQVMILLYKNKSLSRIFQERKPEHMRIQTYRDDSNRKHPLLGLQHIVECVSSPDIPLKHYLCTLCSLSATSSKIIRHLLSFDHTITYLNALHPSTLRAKECYSKCSYDDACTLADFAKQSEELNGRKEIKQVRVKASLMLPLSLASFKEALNKIESDGYKCSLITTVEPGKKLEPSLPNKQQSISEPATYENSAMTQNINEEDEESTIEHSATPAAPTYRFHCQNCSKNFETNSLYFKHLSTGEHTENLIKTFGPVIEKKATECKPHFPTYKYFTEHGVSCVGLSLVVTILSHQVKDEPVHLCFACEIVCPRQDLKLHMNSKKHTVQALMYQNPWKLPFAWKTSIDYLSLQACIEDGEKEPIKNIRILDVPPCLFLCEAPVTFSKVMEKLGQHRTLLMTGVPRRETYSMLKDNDRFPILGSNFMVKYGQATSGWKFLCLLCQRPLSSDDYTGHVFSWEHVFAFLEKYHPGSLDSNTTNEGILDLAKQAAQIHPVSNAQEIEFDSYKHRSDIINYSAKVRLLSAEKTRDGKGPLMPSITPRMKLFLLRKELKTPGNREQIQILNLRWRFPRRQTQETNLDTKTTNEPDAVTKIDSIPGNAVEKLVDDFQTANQESLGELNEPVKVSLLEINNLPTEQEFKEEKDPLNPSEPSQLEKIKEDTSDSSDLQSMKNTVSKRHCNLSDMDTSDSENYNLEPKRMCLSNPEEAKEIQNLQNMHKTKPCCSVDLDVCNSGPCYGSELQTYIQRKIRAPLIGLSAIYECVCNDRAPVYLCECCRLQFKEQYIAKHLSETSHYNSYLLMAGEKQLPSGKGWKEEMTHFAAYWERNEGHGETRVVKLTQEDYDNLNSFSDYKKAFKIVKKYLARKVHICSPALHEEFARTITVTNMHETPQQDKHVETDPEPGATSSNTKLPSKSKITFKSLKDANLTSTMAVDKISQCLSNNGKSAKPKDASESTNIVRDEMEIAACAGTSRSDQPVCKFIKTKAVILKVASETVETVNTGNAIDKIQYIPSASCATTVTPNPTTKPVCTFLTAKSAPRNQIQTDPITRQTTSPLLVDKVPDYARISASTVLNVAKGAPNSQDKSPLPDAVPKLKADCEPSSKAVLLAKKNGTKSSSQTKLPSAMPAHAKSTGIQLKLKVDAASKNEDVLQTSQKDHPQSPQVGVDQLVKIKCKEKRLVYCLACLARLEATNHVTSTMHQINCVKIKFPWWSAKPGEEELSEMVAALHKDEKDPIPMCVEVSIDAYKELKALPLDKAIEKVRDLTRKKSLKKLGQRRLSASTSETSNSQCDISDSPRDVTSPDLGKEDFQTKPQIKSIVQSINKLPVSAMYAPLPSSQVQKPTSKVAPRIITGTTTDETSNLSLILPVKALSVIGLCLVWECRVVPAKHSTFYLCESCGLKILNVVDMCYHLQSTEHQRKYLMKRYSGFMYWVNEEELLPWMEAELTDYIAGLVKCREESTDAQTVLLSEECFKVVRQASFVEALSVVQRIKQEKKTTTLPFIVTSQQEVEPREQQRTQLTLDTSDMLTDLPNQREISIMENAVETMDTQHEALSVGNIASVNADPCTSPIDTKSIFSPQITELLESQSPSIASLNSPKQSDEPACSATAQNLAVSPKDENQEYFEPEAKACSDITSPLSHISPVMSSIVDIMETTSSQTLKNAITDTKPEADIHLGSTSSQETSTVSPNLENNVNKIIEEDLMTEECSPDGHSDANGVSTSLISPSKIDHNANENPPLDPVAEDKDALDKHYCLLLINLLKQTKNSIQQATSASNQTSEPCKAKSPESIIELFEAQRTSRDIEQPQKTDTDVAAIVDNIVTENKTDPSAELPHENLTSGTGLSNNKTEKHTCGYVTSVLGGNLKETTEPEFTTQQSQGQFTQPRDETGEESIVQMKLQLPKIQLQQKEMKIPVMKMVNSVSDSQVSVQTSKLETRVTQTKESQYNSAVHSEIHQSQCGTSQQKQELQLKSDTQEASSEYPPPGLMQCAQSESEIVQLLPQETPVQLLQPTPNQELQLQPQTRVVQSQNSTHQTQGQIVQWESNIPEVQLYIQPSQQQTANLQPTQQVTQQIQSHTEQLPIDSLITPRPQNTMYFRDIDDRKYLCVENTGFQVSQGLPFSSAATPPVTSSTVVFTRGYNHFVQTAYPTNADYSNIHALYGVPHSSAYPSHVYHQLQTQHYCQSVEPFLPNVQHAEVSGWINPNTQLQPVSQSYSVWSNGAAIGTSNVAYSNAVSFNTASNQNYTYSYNNEQEYNRVLMQNLFNTPYAPAQSSQFFHYRP